MIRFYMFCHGTVLYDPVWFVGQDDSLYYSKISFDTAWYGTVSIIWYGIRWYAMVWYAMAWHDMVWYDMVW